MAQYHHYPGAEKSGLFAMQIDKSRSHQIRYDTSSYCLLLKILALIHTRKEKTYKISKTAVTLGVGTRNISVIPSDKRYWTRIDHDTSQLSIV